VVQDARESEDSSTIIHANKSNKRWKLTILLEKPTDVKKVLDTVYLDEFGIKKLSR
jgi:hypothetical protein